MDCDPIRAHLVGTCHSLGHCVDAGPHVPSLGGGLIPQLDQIELTTRVLRELVNDEGCQGAAMGKVIEIPTHLRVK